MVDAEVEEEIHDYRAEEHGTEVEAAELANIIDKQEDEDGEEQEEEVLADVLVSLP